MTSTLLERMFLMLSSCGVSPLISSPNGNRLFTTRSWSFVIPLLTVGNKMNFVDHSVVEPP